MHILGCWSYPCIKKGQIQAGVYGTVLISDISNPGHVYNYHNGIHSIQGSFLHVFLVTAAEF